MYKMIIKQLWNERKGNVLIALEMLVVSVFLWFAADALFANYMIYSRPLGFDIHNTYQVELGSIPEGVPDYDSTTYTPDDYRTLLARLGESPWVEAACFTSGNHFHYRGSNQYATFMRDTLIRYGYVRAVSPEYFEVFRVSTPQGGQPAELAQALRESDIVITGTLADDFFGTSSKAARQEILCADQGDRDSVSYRIGAVCEPQRYNEFSDYDYAYYKAISSDELERYAGEMNTFIRVKPGADDEDFPARFREEMGPRLRLGNFYLKEIRPMSYYRENMIRSWVNEVRLYVSAIVFFLLNVLLGVVGTFWFRTQQRSGEMGLRMAMGATRRSIFLRLVGEGLLLLTLVFIPAISLFVNMMRLEVIQYPGLEVNMAVRFLFGMFFSYTIMTLMILAGISIPAFRSMRLHPAEALRDE